MFESLTDAAFLVHGASILYIIGFLIRDQLILRLLVLVGTGLYIAYYYFAPSTPLWEAIVWSTLLAAANFFIILQLAFERTTFNMNDEELALFAVFNTMTPGEFRKILKLSHWQTAEEKMILARESEKLDKLYYVLSGGLAVQKNGNTFAHAAPAFVGEVAFFLKTPASASVKVQEGSRLISWDTSALDKLQAKNPGIRAAIHGVLNSDMAKKVAKSVGADRLA